MLSIKKTVLFTFMVFGISVLGLTLAVRADDPDDEFDAVEEIPYKERILGVRADRDITLREFEWLCKNCDLLVSHQRHLEDTGNERIRHASNRESASTKLGFFGHKYAIPSLLAVLRDEAEEQQVRRTVVYSLAKIADPRAVEILIDALSIPAAAGDAAESLMGMTGVAIGYRLGGGPPRTPEQHSALQKEWRAWWKDHAGEVAVQRVTGLPNPVPLEKWKPTRPQGNPQKLAAEFDLVNEFPFQDPLQYMNRLRADREMNLRKFTWLCEKSDVLISHHRYVHDWGHRNRNFAVRQRKVAAEALGSFGHKYAYPALLAVLRDEAEEQYVRRAALHGLAMIADPRAVESVIDALAIPDVADAAAEELMAMTGVAIGRRPSGSLPRTHEQYLALQKEWLDWWKEHADEVELQRLASASLAVSPDKWKPTRPRVKPQELEDALPQ